MSLFHNSKQKLKNIQRTIDGLLDGDFPLSSGQNALNKLKVVFSDLELKLNRAHNLSDHAAERQLSSFVSLKIYQTLPILGFILRSTNVRNAFELLDPFQTISDSILNGNPQILLSSEWDYVPFAYPQSLEDLRNFILIGLPASEAASALLVPLAGHELGHAVWRNRQVGNGVHAALQNRCEQLYKEKIDTFKKHFPDYDPNDIIYMEIFPEAIAKSVGFANFQAEELFCDMFAYGIFGESYLYAFSYILAPGTTRSPGSKYPSYKTRITTLVDIAALEGITLPDAASLNFADETPRGLPRERFIIQMAETAVTEIKSALWKNVSDIISSGKVCRPSMNLSEKHLNDFNLGVPAHDPQCLGDILNAGWMFYRNIQQLESAPDNLSERLDRLNEMILKTIEVLEYIRRSDNGP